MKMGNREGFLDLVWRRVCARGYLPTEVIGFGEGTEVTALSNDDVSNLCDGKEGKIIAVDDHGNLMAVRCLQADEQQHNAVTDRGVPQLCYIMRDVDLAKLTRKTIREVNKTRKGLLSDGPVEISLKQSRKCREESDLLNHVLDPNAEMIDAVEG